MRPTQTCAYGKVYNCWGVKYNVAVSVAVTAVVVDVVVAVVVSIFHHCLFNSQSRGKALKTFKK